MKNSVTLRIVLALTFLLTVLAVGGSSAETPQIRRDEGIVHFEVMGDHNGKPLLARVTLSNEDPEACHPPDGEMTDRSSGEADLRCEYGTYSLKVTSPAFKEYTEEDYEVNQRWQIKMIRLSPDRQGLAGHVK